MFYGDLYSTGVYLRHDERRRRLGGFSRPSRRSSKLTQFLHPSCSQMVKRKWQRHHYWFRMP
jgi:hypothetical protein